MTALGNNVHIFAQPHRRQELAWCFEDVLGCSVATVERPGRTESILVVRFPDGGNLSIEFTDSAPDDSTPRLGGMAGVAGGGSGGGDGRCRRGCSDARTTSRPSVLLHAAGRTGLHHRANGMRRDRRGPTNSPLLASRRFTALIRRCIGNCCQSLPNSTRPLPNTRTAASSAEVTRMLLMWI